MGLLAVILAAILYGIIPTFKQIIIWSGIPIMYSTLIGHFLGMVIAWIVVLVKKCPAKINFKQGLSLFTAGFFGYEVCGILMLLAYNEISVGCATVIHFLYPALVCLASAVLFKKKILKIHYLGIILMILGLCFMSTDLAATSIMGIVYAALSAVGWAVYIFVFERTDFEGVPVFTRTAYCYTFAVIPSIAVTIMEGKFYWLDALTLGKFSLTAVGFVVAGFLFVYGIEKIGSIPAAFTSLFEPVFSVLSSWLIFHDQLTPLIIIGMILIFTSIVLINYGDIRSKLINKS